MLCGNAGGMNEDTWLEALENQVTGVGCMNVLINKRQYWEREEYSQNLNISFVQFR